MEQYQLKSFVTVAEEGNLTRAAERLFTSQPAVSAHIKALEEEFGHKLFERTRTGMTLTDLGETLVDEAEDILNRARRIQDRAMNAHNRVCCLRVAINKEPQAIQFELLARTLVENNPDLRLKVTNGMSGAILKNILNGELDAGFCGVPIEDPRLQKEPFTLEELSVFIPATKAPDLQGSDWSVLEQLPWVFTSPQCSYRNYLERFQEEHQLNLQLRYEADDDDTALHFVSNGLAICLMARFSGEPYLANGTVKIWPHFKVLNPIHLVYLKDRKEDPAIQALRSAVQTVLQSEELAIPLAQ
jgi:DNA-binding transcriptional LysR family regulator